MNIESYFKRAKPGAGPAAAGGNSGAGHAASEQPGGGSGRAKQPAANTPSAKDTAPSSDRGAAASQVRRGDPSSKGRNAAAEGGAMFQPPVSYSTAWVRRTPTPQPRAGRQRGCDGCLLLVVCLT